LQINPSEPGASFGLGWVEFKDGNWEQAIKHFSALIDKTDWNAADRKKFLPHSYLNRACCKARSLNDTSGDAEYEPIFSDCKEAINVALELGELDELRLDFNEELHTTGDLGVLALRFPSRVGELRA
jgi:hypothetical protein